MLRSQVREGGGRQAPARGEVQYGTPLPLNRWEHSAGPLAAQLAIYLGFILLVAFGRPLLSILLSPGLSLGILLGALTIVSCWILSIVYVLWANRGYDEAVAQAVAQAVAAASSGRKS